MSTLSEDKSTEPYHHGNLRAALIDAAIAILKADGITKLSLRGVARRAGVSQTAPYRHFKDKAALLSAVAADGFRGLTKSMQTRAAGHTDPKDRLAQLGLGYVDFALSNSAVFRLMFGPEIPDKTADPELAETSGAAFATLATAISPEGDAEPDLGAIPDQAFAAWSFVHGLATLMIDGKIQPDLVQGDIDKPEELALRFGRFFDFSRP